MAIKITVELTCDQSHPWLEPPIVEVPAGTDVALYLKDWLLRHGWSLEDKESDSPAMLCPACTYKRLSDEGYDGVFL